MSGLEDLIGQKSLAALIPRATSEEPLMEFSPVDQEPTDLHIAAAHHETNGNMKRTESDSDLQGNFPDNVITREIMRQAQERSKLVSHVFDPPLDLVRCL